MHTLTRILRSDSLSKMTMNLPKSTPRIQALQAKLDSLKKASKILGSKLKPKNLKLKNLNQDLEEDVYSSDDFFSED